MPTFDAAKVREQNVTFAVVVVKDSLLHDQAASADVMRKMMLNMGCTLIVLMGQQSRRLLGNRQDVVRFVASIQLARLPWRRYTI